jgi:hypothetical protein
MLRKFTLSKFPRIHKTTADVGIAAARNHGLNSTISAVDWATAKMIHGDKALEYMTWDILRQILLPATKDELTNTIYAIPRKELGQGQWSSQQTSITLAEFQKIYICIEAKSYQGKFLTVRGSLFDFILEEHDDERNDALVYFMLGQAIRNLPEKAQIFGSLLRSIVLPFGSNYARKLYRACSQVDDRANPIMRVTVDELRDLLEVPPGKYRDWTDLRRKTLDAAVSEINKRAHFEILVPEEGIRRSGRKVISLELHVRPKLRLKPDTEVQPTQEPETCSAVGTNRNEDTAVQTVNTTVPASEEHLGRSGSSKE